MKSNTYLIFVFIGLLVLTAIYYFFDFSFEVDKIFLSISTFIFSIFTGFFITRQATRYNKVREIVTLFDGKLTSVYRASGHVSAQLQQEIGNVLYDHYRAILDTKQWDIHFTKKSTTLTTLHHLLDEHVKEEEVTKLSNQALGGIIKSLAACQDLRKSMVALREERIPTDQWLLIIFFVVILALTVSMVPSAGLLFASLLKAAFITSVIVVLLILRKLNNLIFSESIMGEHSARDVLAIVEGSR